MLEQNSQRSAETSLVSGAVTGPISYADAMENYRKNTDWWVVFATFDLPDFQSSPIWIANRLKLNLETVIEALEGLVLLGYLTKDSSGYSVIKGKSFVHLKPTELKKSEIIEEHSLISRQVVNQLSEDAVIAVDHRCFASNVEIIKELYSDINAAMEKAFKNSASAKNKDCIFKMSFTAVDVLPGRK